MSYHPSYTTPAGNPPSEYGQNYAQVHYVGQHQAAPQRDFYGGPASYGHSSAPHQQNYWQSGNHLAAGPFPNGRTSFDSSATTAYSASAQGCGDGYNQSRGKSNRTSAYGRGTHGGGGCCVIM